MSMGWISTVAGTEWILSRVFLRRKRAPDWETRLVVTCLVIYDESVGLKRNYEV